MKLSSVSSGLLIHDTSTWNLLKMSKKMSYDCDGIMRDLRWSDDSKYILQVNSAGLAEILRVSDSEVQTVQYIPSNDTWSASFLRGGHSEVAVGTKFGSVKIWDTKHKVITKDFPTPPDPSCIKFLSYNANNTYLAASMVNGITVIYGLLSNIPDLTIKIELESYNISAMKFHLESLIGISTYEGNVIVRDIATSEEKAIFEYICKGPVSDLTFSPINNNLMLSSGYDKMMRVYDIRIQKIPSSTITSQYLTSIATNTDNQVALGTKNGEIFIYDLRELSMPFVVLEGHNHKVNKVAFQPAINNVLTDISLEDDNISLEDVETVTIQRIEESASGSDNISLEDVETVTIQRIKESASGSCDLSDIEGETSLEEVEIGLLQETKQTASGLHDSLAKFFSNVSSSSHSIQIPHSGAENRADQSSLRVWNWLDASNNFNHGPDLNIESDSEKHDLRVNTKRNMVSTSINISDDDNNANNTQDDNKESYLYKFSTPAKNIIDSKPHFSKYSDAMMECLKSVVDLSEQQLVLARKMKCCNLFLENLEKKQTETNRRLILVVEKIQMLLNNVNYYK